ncbi:6-bladed beta-propeller [candidate division KSB1 bacterium]
MKKFTYTLFALGFFVIMGCSGEATYTEEIIDGVRHVHNLAPAWGDEQKISLEFVRQIGELDAVDENYQFFRPARVLKDKTGNMYILDSRNYRIQKFSETGEYLATIGRQGQGPGEFEYPIWMEMGSDGSLYVLDVYIDMFKIMSPEGEETKRIKLPWSYDFLHLTADNFIVINSSVRARLESEDIANESTLISIFEFKDNEYSVLREFGRLHDYKDRDVTYYGNGYRMSVDDNKNIFIALTSQNRIEKYTFEGVLLFTADRPINFELDYEIEEREHQTGTGRTWTSRTPRFNTVSLWVGIDDKNRFWVVAFKKQKEEEDKPEDFLEIQVYDENGIWLTTLPMPVYGGMDFIGDKIYFRGIDDMSIHEYRIVEKR